jgi:hypothetical protein
MRIPAQNSAIIMYMFPKLVLNYARSSGTHRRRKCDGTALPSSGPKTKPSNIKQLLCMLLFTELPDYTASEPSIAPLWLEERQIMGGPYQADQLVRRFRNASTRHINLGNKMWRPIVL